MKKPINLVRALPLIWTYLGMAALVAGGYILGYLAGIRY